MATFLRLLVLFFALRWACASAPAAEPIDLGTRRELFVDRLLLDRLTNARLVLHEPIREGVAVPFDAPWEGIHSAYLTVVYDNGLYRMYYRGMPAAGHDGSAEECTCYAESRDGIIWTKPKLGLFEVQGTRDNNVILANDPPFTHNFSPFLDTRPGVPADERYKAWAGIRSSGLVSFASADGLRWRKLNPDQPFREGAFDSQNVAFWSPNENCYLGYFRTFTPDGIRTVSRTTSPDFIHWTPPVEMKFGDRPLEQLYTNATEPYFRAPHLYIALPKRYLPGKAAIAGDAANDLVGNPNYRKDSSDSVFMTSRGGNQYDRTFMEAFIRPGPSLRDWIARDNTPALGVVPGNDREMFIYRLSHYAQPTCHAARYRLRLDGFISVQAPYEGGELVTPPLKFSGNRLELNFATSAAGGLQVEIQDAQGQPLPGYALADCPEIIGDEIARTVAWNQGSDLSKLAGQPVRLRFALRDADLYAVQFPGAEE
jgi:hypothetical protein